MGKTDRTFLKSELKRILLEFCNDKLIFINTMNVIYPIIKVFDLDQSFLETYLLRWFKKCEENNDKLKTEIRLIIKFMSELIEKKLFDVTHKAEIWISYADYFHSTKGMKEFQNLLKSAIDGAQSSRSG